MKRIPIYPVIIFLIVFLIYHFELNAQTGSRFSGTWTMQSEEAILTLVLKESTHSEITGTLKSTTGISYRLQGERIDDAFTGTCRNDEGSLFFEAYTIEDEMILSLTEMDENNNPDYNTSTYLSFTKAGSSPVPGIESSAETASEKKMIATGNRQSKSNNAMNNEENNPPSAVNTISNPSWGFQFAPPSGWVYQQSGEGVILGHNTIAGMIVVFPHMLQNMQEIRQEMFEGIGEEGTNLQLNGGLSSLDNNILAGDYSGFMDGQEVKAKGYGTLSPNGSGAFIIAVSTPDKLGDEIITTAKKIAGNLFYTKMNASGLMQHFAGKWTNYTTNTSSSIMFYPDGTFDELYESSYSGDLSGGGNWGTSGNNRSTGRWTVQGNKDAGKIIVNFNNGQQVIYEYRVHEEGGQKYDSEYWFNGSLYGKSRD